MTLCLLQNCNRPARNSSYWAFNIEHHTLFTILAKTEPCQTARTPKQRLNHYHYTLY